MNKFSLVASGLISIIFMLASCYNDNAELLYGNTSAVACDTVISNYSTLVQPILATKCATSGCHDAASAQGGMIFQNHAQVSAAKDRIYQRVIVERSMPPTGPLPQSEINKIKCWIENGAQNN